MLTFIDKEICHGKNVYLMTATIERYVKQQFMYFNKVMFLRKNIEKQKIVS